MQVDFIVLRRFWAKVDRTGDCWVWRAGRDQDGYGTFALNGNGCRATHVIWEMFFGDIPDGFFICHSCDNPSCVRPEHLWLGTPKQNTQDAARKGRMGPKNPARGERSGSAKLTEAQVIEIRQRWMRNGERTKSLSAEFGVSTTQISAIVTRKKWKHLP